MATARLGAKQPAGVLCKRIKTPQDIDAFKASPAHQRLTSFIRSLADAVRQKRVSDAPSPSKAVTAMIELVSSLSALVDATSPLKQPSRFGNKAFRTYVVRMTEAAPKLLKSVYEAAGLAHDTKTDSSTHTHLQEHTEYLARSFGDATRIDYGSGHELNFVALLCSMSVSGLFAQEDMSNLVLRVFREYLRLCRKIQRTYQLEPAGSHGVWGLDDHQFLCYYWGASQLIGQEDVTPSMIPEEAEARRLADEYLFFEAVAFIFDVKSGPFFEHSRYLFDIGAVKAWEKVESGLWKMFQNEVLYKFPVIQHFFFGDLLPFGADRETAQEAVQPSSPHVAAHTTAAQNASSSTNVAADVGQSAAKSEVTGSGTGSGPGLAKPEAAASANPRHPGVNTGTLKQGDLTKTWGGPVPKRDPNAPTPFVASSVPMTGMPGVGQDPFANDDQPPAAPSTAGRARVAERGSLAKRP